MDIVAIKQLHLLRELFWNNFLNKNSTTIEKALQLQTYMEYNYTIRAYVVGIYMALFSFL